MALDRPPAPLDQLSHATQIYLAEIYRLGQGRGAVNTTTLAQKLQSSSSLVVRLTHRLQADGLIDHHPYQGIGLTAAGRQAALLSLRRHRLIERLLVDVFQLGWHEIHPVANHVQKGVRQSLEDKLDQILGQPTTCPHGEPIPARTGHLIEPADRPLIVVPPGGRGEISRVRTRHSQKLQYLAEIGCVPGVPFELVRREPFNGPLWLSLGRGEQVIGGEVAGLVWVRLETSI